MNTEGNPIRKSNLIRRWWHPLLARAGLPRIRFHDTRHTAASLLLLEGVHPKVVQERLGHASIGLTLDTYSHLIPSLQAEAARRLDRMLTREGVSTSEDWCQIGAIKGRNRGTLVNIQRVQATPGSLAGSQSETYVNAEIQVPQVHLTLGIRSGAKHRTLHAVVRPTHVADVCADRQVAADALAEDTLRIASAARHQSRAQLP